MLRVTVEIVPSGNEANKLTLAVMHVINRGDGDSAKANYIIHLMYEDGTLGSSHTNKMVNRNQRMFHFIRDVLNQLPEDK